MLEVAMTATAEMKFSNDCASFPFSFRLFPFALSQMLSCRTEPNSSQFVQVGVFGQAKLSHEEANS